jgi:hypothetical protein
MSTSTALTLQQLLAVAAEIKDTCHPGFDKTFADDDLRMQQVNYAGKVEHRATFRSLSLEKGLTITLRSPESGREVTVQLSPAVQTLVCQPIGDELDERLLDLEAKIVQGHIVKAQEALRAANEPDAEFDYAAAVLRLCIEAPTATVVDEPIPTPTPPHSRRGVAGANASRRTPLDNHSYDNQATVAA